MKKWYVVYEGSVSGVYEHWEDSFKKVNKFKVNNYKIYKSKAEAEARYLNYRQGQEMKNHRTKSNFIVISFLLSSLPFSCMRYNEVQLSRCSLCVIQCSDVTPNLSIFLFVI